MWKVLFCVIVALGLSDGAKETREPRTKGVGAFAYQDSTGNRYGGTYGLKDGQVFNRNGDQIPPFFNGNFAGNDDEAINNFFPEYFRNFENILQEAFQYNYEGQQLALNAARKAFDLTSNHAGYIPNFATRFAPPSYNPGFHGFQGFPGSPGFNGFGAPNFDNFGPNSAFAFGAVGPDFSHQIAAINPENPAMENVNVMNRFAEVEAPTRGGFKSVSTSSFSSSKNINGKEERERSASTIINDNGKVTKYEVHGGS